MERLASLTPQPHRGEARPDQLGATPACHFLELLANSPVVTEAYLFYESALANGQLTVQQREMIALAVAEINGSKYGLSAHCAAARKAGLSDDQIRLARKAAAEDPRNNALLHFTRAVALQRGEVSDADFQVLRAAGFTDGQITETMANIALNIFTNYFNSMAQTVVDFPLVRPGADLPAVSDQGRAQPG